VARARHAAVYPCCAAVVHHGGAGTSHAAARAGVPSVVVPHLGDQFFWARALSKARVAPRPIRRQTLTAKKLARRIREAVDSSAMRDRAARLGSAIRAENGVGRAIELIERLGEPT
jgi:sterol 3beta-glucosyltransferase